MSEHNSRDCAALVSLTVEKQLAAKYRDMQCLLPLEEIQVQGSLFFSSKNLFFSKPNVQDLSFSKNANVVFIEKSEYFLKTFKRP